MKSKVSGALHEQTFNIQLADALRKTNARWRNNESFVKVERQDGAYRIDIEIDDDSIPKVVIECE